MSVSMSPLAPGAPGSGPGGVGSPNPGKDYLNESYETSFFRI